MTEILNKEFSRTSFLKGGGAMIVGFSLVGAAAGAKSAKAAGIDPYASAGPFDAQARNFSSALWLRMHRGWLALAGAAVAAFVLCRPVGRKVLS